MTVTVTRLLLWRHGQTEWNVVRRFQGQLDIPLDDTGRAQVRESAKRLAAVAPTVIVSSDLSRAADTAAELAARTGIPVSHDARLREQYFGQWQGLTMSEIEPRWPAAVARYRAGEPVDDAGLESGEEVEKRVYQALHEVVATTPGGTVVVVTHGGSARRGIGAVLDWPQPVIRSLAALRNCHWSELRHHPDRGWQLWSHNAS